MSPISIDAIRQLADAAGSLKLTTLSMATLRQARPREGADDAGPAATYADTMNSAIQSSQASQVALNRAQVEIEAQESLRQQQLQREAEIQARALDRERRRRALEVARTEAQVEAQEVEETREDGGGRNHGGEASGHGGESHHPSGPDDAPRPAEGAAEKGVLYTHQGTVKGKAPENKVTYTA